MVSVAERLSAAGTANALELRGVRQLFGALVALDDVTMSVRPGERRAVLGSNGAGKTTLFNAVTGDFPPSSGVIRFFGRTSPGSLRTNVSGGACGAPTRSRCCSAI